MVFALYIMVGVINMIAVLNDYYIPNTPELRDIRVRRNAQFEPYATGHKADNTNLDIRKIISGDYFKERVKRNYPVYPQTGYVNQVNSSWNYGGAYPGYYNTNLNSTGYNTARGNNYPTGVYYNGYSGVPYYPQYLRNNTHPGYRYPVYAPYSNTTNFVYNANAAYAPYPNNTYPGYNLNPVNNPYQGYRPHASNVSYPNVGKNSSPGYGSNINHNQYPGYSSNSNYNANTYSPYNPSDVTAGYTTPSLTTTTPRIDKSCIICNIGCPQFMKRFGYVCVEDDDYS